MNTDLIRLIGLLKIYNGGKLDFVLERELKVFADSKYYNITTIKELINAMEEEMSYWTDK